MNRSIIARVTGMTSGLYLGDEDEEPAAVLAVSAWVPADAGGEVRVELELTVEQVAQLARWAAQVDPTRWLAARRLMANLDA